MSENNKKEIKTQLGELREAVHQMKEEPDNILEALKAISSKRPIDVTIEYEDIEEKMFFTVHPITVEIELELQSFQFKMERDRHVVAKCVTTKEGYPLGYKEINLMPLGMMNALVETAENLATSHQIE